MGAAKDLAALQAGNQNQAGTGRHATVDHWYADLTESLIHFGPHARRIHSLDDSRERFGIGEVIRNYNDADKPEILGLFETISPARPEFEFISRLRAGDRIADVRWIARLDMARGRVEGVIIITDIAAAI